MSAPLAEARLGSVIRTYERVKLGLMLLVLIIDIAIGGYLIGLAHTNYETLKGTKQTVVILECAVDKNTSVKPDGKARTHAEAQAAFDACVKAGGPKGTPTR